MRSNSFPNDLLLFIPYAKAPFKIQLWKLLPSYPVPFKIKILFCGINAVDRSQEYLNVSQTNTCSSSIREWIGETIICPRLRAMTYRIKLIALTQVRANVCSNRFSRQLKLTASKSAPVYMRATVKLIWCHASFRKSCFMLPAHILVWSNSTLQSGLLTQASETGSHF